MFKKILLSIVIIWLFVFISTSFALSKKEKGLILEQFKSKEYDMLFEADNFALDWEDRNILNISRKINIYWNIKDSLSSKRKYAQMASLKKIEKVNTLEETIKLLDKDIETKTRNVAIANTEIIKIKKEIESSEKIISNYRKIIEKNRVVLLDYLVYIYKKWNYVYNDNSIDNLKAIIFSNEDIGNIINDLYFKWIIELTWKKLIDRHREYIKKLYFIKISLKKKQEKLKLLRKNGIIERKIIKDKQEYKKRILTQTKWQEVLFNKYIKDKLKLERAIKIKQLKEKIKFSNIQDRLLKKYDCVFVDIWKDKEKAKWLSDRCLGLNKMIYWESRLKWFWNDGINIFSWPVFPEYGISWFFHDKEYKKDFGSEHEAIDIITAQWTNIKAPADWYVIYVLPPKTTDYAYFAIKHSNWYVTVYGHVSEIFVKEFDFVRQWQVIWKTGWEYGTIWAWLITTGPHLHFEVFSDKKPVDPLNYLNLSLFSFDSLPEKYKYKFYSDFRSEKGYEYKNRKENSKSFKLEWVTETDRQKYLLNKYATNDFNKWDVWVEESLDWKIDPTFVMCIWLAESSLWRNLKTPYNVWNVWNTDSWDVVDFMNARSGIYWIVKTLNNKILWNYNEIKDLSRYWNDKWPIYSSSTDHWHNNIIKCMSAIKWTNVPDYYNFRINN